MKFRSLVLMVALLAVPSSAFADRFGDVAHKLTSAIHSTMGVSGQAPGACSMLPNDFLRLGHNMFGSGDMRTLARYASSEATAGALVSAIPNWVAGIPQDIAHCAEFLGEWAAQRAPAAWREGPLED